MRVKIDRFGINGEGIAKLDNGKLVFIKNALPDETVEIDIIEENGLELYAYEIKASETMNPAFFSNIKKVKNVIGLDFKNTAVIYGGTREIPSSNECGAYISWKKL